MAATPSMDRPITSDMTRIGWIRTGIMGRSMAGHLLSVGYSLAVFNGTHAKAQPLLVRDAKLADSLAIVVRANDVIFLIVGYPSNVRRVALDASDGALSGLAPGLVLVDMTISYPTLAVEIADTAHVASYAAVDVPVSSGNRGARAWTLSIFAGGDEAIVQRLERIVVSVSQRKMQGRRRRRRRGE